MLRYLIRLLCWVVVWLLGFWFAWFCWCCDFGCCVYCVVVVFVVLGLLVAGVCGQFAWVTCAVTEGLCLLLLCVGMVAV